MSNKPNRRPTQMNQQPRVIQLDTKDCNRRVCKECGHDGFDKEFMVFEIPISYRAVFNNQSEIEVAYYKCTACGLRQELKELATDEPLNKIQPAVKLA